MNRDEWLGWWTSSSRLDSLFQFLDICSSKYCCGGGGSGEMNPTASNKSTRSHYRESRSDRSDAGDALPVDRAPRTGNGIDEDEDVVLLNMLAEAERLSNELKDTCSSAVASSRGHTEHPESSVADRSSNGHLPETIDMKDHATECSSIGNGVSVAPEAHRPVSVPNAPVYNEIMPEVARETHRFMAPESVLPTVPSEEVKGCEDVSCDAAPVLQTVAVDDDRDTSASERPDDPIPTAPVSVVVLSPLTARDSKESTNDDKKYAPPPAPTVAPTFDSTSIEPTDTMSSNGTMNMVEDTCQGDDEVLITASSPAPIEEPTQEQPTENSNAFEEQTTDVTPFDEPTLTLPDSNNMSSRDISTFEAVAAVQAAEVMKHQLSAALNSSVSYGTILAVSTSADSLAALSSKSVRNDGYVQASLVKLNVANEQSVKVLHSPSPSTEVTPLSSNKISVWEATTFATQGDKDYTPMADYSDAIKWERVTSARQGDDDYVPMSDYCVETRPCSEDGVDPDLVPMEMTYSGHIAAIRRRRKQRHCRLFVFAFVSSVAIGIALFRRLHGFAVEDKGLEFILEQDDIVILQVEDETMVVAKVDTQETIVDASSIERTDDSDEPDFGALVLVKHNNPAQPFRPLAIILKGIQVLKTSKRQERRAFVEELIDSMME